MRKWMLMLLVCLVAGTRLPAESGPGQWEQLMLQARAAFKDGHYAESDKLYGSAATACETAGIRDERFARSLYELAMVRQAEGRVEEASNLYQRGIAILENIPDRSPSELGDVWQALAATYLQRRLFAKAENASQRALDIESAAPTPRANRISEDLTTLAAIDQFEGKYAEAETVLDRAEALADKAPKDGSLNSVLLLANLGTLFRDRGKPDEAEDAFRRGLAALNGTEDRSGLLLAAHLWNNIGAIEFGRNEYGKAEGAFSRALEIIAKGIPLGPAGVAKVMRNYAACLRRKGNKAEARRMESKAAELARNLPQDRERELVVDVTEFERPR
jgi:tetratricopeptide (TPR) repeat protein